MEQQAKKWLLAVNPSIGAIYRCGHCDNIHMRFGATDYQMTTETYMSFVDMVNRSAANFEVMLEAGGVASKEWIEGGAEC